MIHPFSEYNIYKTGNVVVAVEKRFKYIAHCHVAIAWEEMQN